jgi:hypothetical protein
MQIIATHLGERCNSRTSLHGNIQAVEGTANGGVGSVTISWNTGSGRHGQVFLSRDDGPEELFAEGACGSAECPPLERHVLYEFRLYEGHEHVRLLATVMTGLEEER